MKKYYLLLLIALTLSLATVAPAEQSKKSMEKLNYTNATTLKELVKESEKNLETYRFTFTQDQNIAIIKLPAGNATYQTKILTLGAGGVNLTGKALKTVSTSLSIPIGQEENATAATTELYFLNDTIYRNVNGNRTVLNLTFPENIWMSQNKLEQSSDLINSSKVKLLGTEAINGVGYYVIEVTPDSSTLSDLVSRQLGSNFSKSLPTNISTGVGSNIYGSTLALNLSALLNNTRLRYVIWITEDSHLPNMEYVQMSVNLTPDMFSLLGTKNLRMNIDSVTTVIFSGFNQTVNIALPKEVNTAGMSSSNNTNASLSGPAVSNDPHVTISDISNDPVLQQEFWLAGAYAFLNGDYYSSRYGYPYMSYGMYSPYYTPYYTPYFTYSAYPNYNQYPSYSSYTPATQVNSPLRVGYTLPSQGYVTPTQGYTVMTNYNPALGTYLTDGRGMTLYHLVNDGGNYNSVCKDMACTGIWPPFYAQTINVPTSLNPADLRTINVNGYKQYQQTSYKGWPLYYYSGDTAPGQINGQGLKDSYGTWSVVSTDSANTFPATFPYSSGTATSPTAQPYTTTPSTTTTPYSPSGY